MAFEQYDIGLVNSALPQISQELAIATGDTGYFLSAIRLGGFGTFLLLPFADRLGRRRIFLASLIGMSLGSFATAFSPTAEIFVIVQLLTRVFMLTGAALALVILIEEFPAEHRGAAIGLMALLGGLGYGLGAGLYAAVDLLPFGWRALYAIGGLPLLLIPFYRRSLRETRRFAAHSERAGMHTAGGLVTWLEPLRDLLRTHPRRAATVGLTGLFASMGSIVFFQYTSYFVQNVHGWAPGDYALLVLGGGLIGVSGNWIGGRGSDRLGRRPVGFVCLCLAPLAATLFYRGPESTLVLAWGLYVLVATASDLVVRAFSAELFPTSHRGTSSGWLVLVQTVGFTTGLFLVGYGTESLEDLGETVTWVSLATLVAGVALLWLPETRRVELEEISESPSSASG